MPQNINKLDEKQVRKESNMPENSRFSLTIIRNIVLILCLLAISSGISFYVGYYNIRSFKDFKTSLQKSGSQPKGLATIDRSQPVNKNVDMHLFWQVWDKLERDYLFKDRIDYQQMVYGAIKGMTAAVGDPYTAFYPPAKNQTSKENLNGSFEGVGIQLGYKMGDQLAVIAPITGMPAEKMGVKAGDFILHIKDDSKGIDLDTYNMSLAEAVEYIRGQKNTEVTITFLHEGENQPYTLTMKRETIVVPSVEVKFGQVINGQFTTEATGSGKLVAHLMLTKFGELTDDQWDEAILKIIDKKDEVGGVVLDLRNNPGGYMQEAVNLAGEFLPFGKVVVKQENSNAPNQEFTVNRYGRLLTVSMVVLVNQGSASASEILAGALRDNNRSKIVGQKSFGKGTIQSAEDLENGAGLHITIARWLTPNGTWVHEKGLEPDVKVDLDPKQPTVDTQLNKAAELVLGN